MPTGQTSLELVPVGDVGNAADTTGYGRVNYAYNIGKYEVTAGQYTAFLNAVAATDTYGLYNMWSDSYYSCKINRTGTSGSYSYSVASDWANRPVNYVSFGDSMRFANWMQNGQPTGLQNARTTEDGAYFVNGATSYTALQAVARKSNWQWAVTSEDEWYKAAYYKGGSTNAGYWMYPTQSNTAPGQDMNDASGNNANYYTAPYAYPIDSGRYTTVAGEFQNSDSAYGTFDQGGNVWEWNEAIIYGSYRGLRGGSFGDYDGDLQAGYRYDDDPTFESHYIGFRLSQVPEPASMGLLGIGVLGLFAGRRGTRR
jgi:formylglycine-generating enzyme required for sulfatase activity